MVGQVTISPREVREACFGLELKADQIYRCDITVTHRRDGDPSGALLSHSLFHKFWCILDFVRSVSLLMLGMGGGGGSSSHFCYIGH